MENSRSEVWKEIKDGLGIALQIIMYTFIVMSTLFGAGYVYYTCCQ